MTKQEFAEQCREIVSCWDAAALYKKAAVIHPYDSVLADMLQRVAMGEEAIIRYVCERMEAK